jgi:hypothetical protein
MTNEKATPEIFRKKLVPVCVFVHGEFQKSVGFVSRIRVFWDGGVKIDSQCSPCTVLWGRPWQAEDDEFDMYDKIV